MNKRKLNALSNELRESGAAPKEAAQLSRLAAALGALESTEKPLPSSAPLPRRAWWKPASSVGLVGVLLVALLVTFSQTSLPGSSLYPVKRTSEWVAVRVQPGFHGTVMMRRAEEVQGLVDHHANSQLVLQTLADYQTDAQAYKYHAGDYSLFEHCSNSLRQAQARATTTEQQAIEHTLSTLQDS